MGKLTRNHGDLCYNIDGDTMKQSENIKQSITEEDQAKQEIQRGLVNWANHVLDLYQQMLGRTPIFLQHYNLKLPDYILLD